MRSLVFSNCSWQALQITERRESMSNFAYLLRTSMQYIQTNNDHHQVCTQNQIAIESYESAMVSFYPSLNLPQLLIGLITFCRSILTFMYFLAFSRDIHQWVSTQQLHVPVLQIWGAKQQKFVVWGLGCFYQFANLRPLWENLGYSIVQLTPPIIHAMNQRLKFEDLKTQMLKHRIVFQKLVHPH